MDEEQKITLYEADLYEKEEPKEKSVQFIVFRISTEWYGVEITKVKEVVPLGRITYLPSAPAHISGITHLRGNILSVTDLKSVFSLSQGESSGKSKLVVIASGVLETGLLVDDVAEPMEVALTAIDPALVTMALDKAGFIEGEFKRDNKLVGILKLEKILEGWRVK